MGQRRRCTEEYRCDAASLVLDTGHTIRTVTQQLDLGEHLLGSWVNKERIRRTSIDIGQPSPEETAADIARLRKEIAGLKAENEFLRSRYSLVAPSPSALEWRQSPDTQACHCGFLLWPAWSTWPPT